MGWKRISFVMCDLVPRHFYLICKDELKVSLHSRVILIWLSYVFVMFQKYCNILFFKIQYGGMWCHMYKVSHNGERILPVYRQFPAPEGQVGFIWSASTLCGTAFCCCFILQHLAMFSVGLVVDTQWRCSSAACPRTDNSWWQCSRDGSQAQYSGYVDLFTYW